LLLGAIVAEFVKLESPFTLYTPSGYLSTALAITTSMRSRHRETPDAEEASRRRRGAAR
jgi:hypothetical protein